MEPTRMGSVERLRKPAPERTGPVRQWNAPGAAPRPAPDAGDTAAAEPPGGEGAPGAVGLGYHVIEEYLQQGRRAAEGMGAGLGLEQGLAAAGSFQALSARLFRDALVWLEHLTRLSTAPPPGAAADGAPTPSPDAVATGFLVNVASPRPVAVDLKLQSGMEGRALGVHDLRATDPAAPPLGPVEVAHAGRWRVDLRVPEKQPPGLYTGIVYDRRDGAICGTLAVEVSLEAGAR